MSPTFRQYEIQEKIGSGGMATVYRGRHLVLDSPVAVKVLHRELAFDETFISRFELEARVAASIQSPNIVKVLDYGSEGEVYFIVMEFVEGEDLGRLFNRLAESGDGPRPFPPEICLLILHDVAFGLRAAHHKRITHRDIKPSNILLDSQGLVRVADFGLARDGRRQQDTGLTRTGTVLGTPSYMSPEQAIGEVLDGRTDIFSLGVVAYQLLSGRKPFTGQTPSEVQQNIIDAEPPALDPEAVPWITPEVAHLLDRCLQKDREKRFQDMDQVLGAVRAAQESLDPKGTCVIHKHEYLARFAADPAATVEQMRQESIKCHLRRGLHLKGMGLGKLDDALFEFRYVRALDPGNGDARRALKELQRARADSGANAPAAPAADDPDRRTRIIAPSGDASSSAAAASPLRPRWLVPGALALLALVALAWFGRGLLGSGEPAPAPTALVAADAESPPETVPTADPAAPPPVSTPAEQGEATPPERTPPPAPRRDAPPTQTAPPSSGTTAARPAAAPAAGPTSAPGAVADGQRLEFRVADECRVLVDGRRVFSGLGAVSLPLEAGAPHRVELEFPLTFSRLDLGEVTLAAGRDDRRGTLMPELGFLRFEADEMVSVALDDRVVLERGLRLPYQMMGVGTHVLTVRRDGAQVKSILGNGRPLPRLSSGPDGERFRIEIEANLDLRVLVVMD